MLVNLLLMETELFHRVARKAFGGLTNRRLEASGKIYWSENKGLSLGTRCLIQDRVAQLHPATV